MGDRMESLMATGIRCRERGGRDGGRRPGERMEISMGVSLEQGRPQNLCGDPSSFLIVGDIELEATTLCSQVELPVEEGGHQSTHKTFYPKFVLLTRSIGIKMEQILRKWQNNDCPNL